MTAPKEVDGWKVRVVVQGDILHFVSMSEPEVIERNGRMASLEWTPSTDGDTPGFIDWPAVTAVTWRHGSR